MSSQSPEVKVEQVTRIKVEIAGKVFSLICDSDSPLGSVHDTLMQIKGWCVERMVAAQREEQAASDALQKQETHIE